MSSLNNPFDPDRPLSRCSCGHHASQAEHDGACSVGDVDALNSRVVQTAVMRALFPQDAERRRFLSVVGASTAWAAISSLVPFGTLEAMAQEKGSLEKKDLNIGFIPITCASPLIMADPLGFYKKQGLNVSVIKTAGWALIRDKVINKEYDASHMLAPMPLAMSMGVGSSPMPVNVATIQNVNGQAITLHVKHKDKRDPKMWKGFKFAVPFEYSMHNFLLRYYVAEHGLDPDKDIQIRVVPPPEMVANLRAGNLDGYLGPDPFNQRAVYDEVGFIHILSKDIWDGHPCCSFGVPTQFVKENPNTFAALYRAVLTAAAMANDPKNRSIMAEVLAPANYLNQPKTVLEQVLTGKFADGLGGVQNVPDRAGFDPFPWYSMAVWILTQMKRWGYIKGDVRYKDIAEQVYLLTDARKRMAEVGLTAPKESYRTFKVMGKEFDPAKPEPYVNSFAIRRT
ncbi:MAG: ABC transporter substrate-binding protein [Gammaproteobacteria bacterium]|nr:ABC transporter substrate-binding protein [Rhodocyclaceae bacterium]MBU3908340.1 ABC transporter substrate-binding protein [Gammaproteobacteria bacterium]MBU3987849.1 ABC transporter substrate-binding protein [Gammaproteobacteria bacterium]MBU4004050.1 ABC transporter substrate-binding protein [Gammaproteobacteria bacterium]MBU4020297.1 ABC transporter substrate-binding protein [Gammaproteobacteria bacterium]